MATEVSLAEKNKKMNIMKMITTDTDHQHATSRKLNRQEAQRLTPSR